MKNKIKIIKILSRSEFESIRIDKEYIIGKHIYREPIRLPVILRTTMPDPLENPELITAHIKEWFIFPFFLRNYTYFYCITDDISLKTNHDNPYLKLHVELSPDEVSFFAVERNSENMIDKYMRQIKK
jgi:hypothetical protein